MSIERTEIDRIARLARLRLSEEEGVAMVRHLGGILDYVRELAELDLKGVEPCTFAAEGGAPGRIEEPKPGLTRDEALSGAPETRDGFFVVPAAIEPSSHGANDVPSASRGGPRET